MKFLNSGSSEGFKALWHIGLGFGLAGAFAYNVLAYTKRREYHLAVNSVVYGSGLVLEGFQVRRHLLALERDEGRL